MAGRAVAPASTVGGFGCQLRRGRRLLSSLARAGLLVFRGRLWQDGVAIHHSGLWCVLAAAVALVRDRQVRPEGRAAAITAALAVPILSMAVPVGRSLRAAGTEARAVAESQPTAQLLVSLADLARHGRPLRVVHELPRAAAAVSTIPAARAALRRRGDWAALVALVNKRVIHRRLTRMVLAAAALEGATRQPIKMVVPARPVTA